MTRLHQTPVAAEAHWMMQLGERFAFEGLLCALRPQIDTWEGGSLRAAGRRRRPEANGHEAFIPFARLRP